MNISVLLLVSTLGLSFFTQSCKARTRASEVKVDSATSTFFDAEINDGVLFVKPEDSEGVVLAKITAQLSYTLGQLQYFDASTDNGRNTVKILSREPAGELDSESDIVRYQTTLMIAWPKEKKPPKALRFALPIRVNEIEKTEVYKYYSKKFFTELSAKCIEPKEPSKPDYKFWNYVRPRRPGCPLLDIVNEDTLSSEILYVKDTKLRMAAVTAVLKPSGSSTSGKKPEYEEIWRDGKLVVVSIFTPNMAVSESDTGVIGLKEAISGLVDSLGTMDGEEKKKKPKSANFDLNEDWKKLVELGYYQMTFDSPRGEVIFHFILTAGIRDGYSADVKERLGKIGSDVDIYGFFGHSSLGKNIRAFTTLPPYKAHQYSILVLSACNSFMYVDSALGELNKRLNPGTSTYKYFDIIAAATLSPFGTEFRDLYALVDGAIGKKRTYREILDHFGTTQRALVFGEEDNGEPFPGEDH